MEAKGRTAALAVFNSESAGAIDAHWVIGGNATELADELKPGEGGALVEVDILRGRIEVRTAGVGKLRLLRKAKRLRAGHSYCVFVGQGRLAVEDMTRQLRRDPSPEKVCQQLALGR